MLFAQVVVSNPNGSSYSVNVKSWKEIRDAQVIKQAYDFSCGAASMATLLRGAYGVEVTEMSLLEAMGKTNGRASFSDMARVLQQYGFRAQGYSASFSQLERLTMPVILYVKHRKYDHFTVLRGISGNTVWLADPSTGNQTLSRAQFLDMWETIQAKTPEGTARGKFLAIFPADSTDMSSSKFLDLNPVRQSRAAMLQLALTFRR